MIGPIGLTELIVILLIVLPVFGPSKLGDIGSSLGKGISGFKKAMKDENSKEENSDNNKEEN